LNPFKKMKLKSKLRNCDYKLAGTVIKQQYYNENSYTEINRMIDHFMEEPGFDRALELIDYNEMIVFYFTESCTDGLYVRKAPVDSAKSFLPPETSSYEQAPIFAEPPIRTSDDLSSNKQSSDFKRNIPSAHSENLQKIQESEEWMDQMINRLAKKPKLPAETEISFTTVTPPAKVYNEEDVESFDTIEFKSAASFRDIEEHEETEISPEIEVFYETEVYKEVEVFQETEVYKEVEVFHEEDVSAQEDESKAAFEFVASATSSQHLDAIDPAVLFASPPTPEPERNKRPSFPNVVATLKIDLHTMIKQLDEYRHQLAYHPHNEQQMISWIKVLEKAIDEFSAAIDIIESSYESTN
jgi:hypothetical protein